MTQRGSVSFDRAVDYYDRTRALPPARAAAQTALLATELAAASGPCLEIGVGTGRVALPLAEAGARVVGLDLSAPMLERLRAKDPGATVPVVRVVVPGGVLLATRGRPVAGLLADMSARIRAEADIPANTGGLDLLDELDAYMDAHGAGVGHLAPIPPTADERVPTLADYFDQTADGIVSWTWAVDPDRLRAAVKSVRAWATAELGDPAGLPVRPDPIRWHRYTLPG